MAEFSLREIFEALAGRWILTRQIPDGVSFEGVAVFEKIDFNTALLSESGNITMPDKSEIAASRRWLWRCGEEDRLDIFYDEEVPRLYHSLTLALEPDGLTGEAIHHCGEDAYLGRYRLSQNVLEIDHQVRGPNKHYELSSSYKRVLS